MATTSLKARLSVIACCVAALSASTAQATENGTQHYPVGLLTASQSIMPEPGNATVQNYDVIYDADRMNDGNGNKLLPDFHLNVKVQATRFIYTWPIELNGLTISSGSAVNFYNTSLSVGAEHGERFQLADTNVSPIMLRWTNRKNLHVMVAANVWAPTGSYRANRLVNAGLNYWSGDLEAGFTGCPPGAGRSARTVGPASPSTATTPPVTNPATLSMSTSWSAIARWSSSLSFSSR
jgi:hypothetical protein